ncbi:MAG: 2-hydroxy-acid oxidase [Caulobacterales bacterium 68-7]|nr:glycolate oxidase subunit GlcF [Caulobacterales bacterium]OJU09347.1 MAG: 2-hydroxy-acid oxidase [Caulobacterales bacterium 68-7]
MKTDLTAAQLMDPDTASSEKVLRKCVHCGFCTATCPTYVLLGDELDSPRGRIYQIKEMLEKGGAPSPETVKHVDRCLSCLSCMTTCPSGVNYMHLVDHARSYIEEHHVRPLPDRLLRSLLSRVLPNRALFRLSLTAARLGRPFAGLLPGRLKGMVAMAPASLPKASPTERPGVFPAVGERRARVAMLAGCAQAVLAPQINDSVVRLLNRHGVEVVIVSGSDCCGSLDHHIGKTAKAHALAKVNIAAWSREAFDAIVVATSGCGTTVKDYGFMFRDDPEWAERAAKVASLAKDLTEVLDLLELQTPVAPTGLAVAYHSACSMQHGQKVDRQPRRLLAAAGFQVLDVPEGHICCGSAGTYNLLQPEIAKQLQARKVANIESTRPQLVATGNIGCMVQIAGGTQLPVVHVAQLLDWATGGPKPAELA